MSIGARYFDIMKPRRAEGNVFKFMSRYWTPQKSRLLDKYYTPQELKDAVANSVYIDSVIEAVSLQSQWLFYLKFVLSD